MCYQLVLVESGYHVEGLSLLPLVGYQVHIRVVAHCGGSIAATATRHGLLRVVRVVQEKQGTIRGGRLGARLSNVQSRDTLLVGQG